MELLDAASAGYIQAGRILRIETPLGADVLLPEHMEMREAINDLFTLTIAVRSKKTDIKPDEIVGKISEIFLAFPSLLIAIAIMAFLGQGVGNLIMALMLSRWVQYCRVVRGEVLSIKERDFVTAAKALGGKDWYVLFRHVVPNT